MDHHDCTTSTRAIPFGSCKFCRQVDTVSQSRTGFSKTRLRDLLKSKGLEEGDLAQRFGTSRAHSWLNGTRRPRADETGFELADWLEVPIEYLYGRPSSFQSLSAEDAA